MTLVSRQKVKVLFFAWGDSIHARRRIGIFCDDPSFEVGVVSNFPYRFENAKHFYLPGALKNKKRSLLAKIGELPVFFFLRVLGGVSRAECSHFLSDLFLVRRYIHEFNPKVVFLQTLLYPTYLCYFWLNKIPLVITFWNGDLTWWAKWTGMERAFKKQIVRYGVRRADAITVNSQAALRACLDYGVREEKMKLIRYPGVNLQIFRSRANKVEVRDQLGIPRDGRMVFCPRGVGGYLNSDVILEAAAEVVRQFPDTIFLFLLREGDEEVWDIRQKRTEVLGLAKNVIGIHQVPWEEMPRYYQAADVMVSISSNDSLPNCMLEAMACGVPVIMGDIPQIKAWVIDGENGYSVPPRDPSALAERIVRIFTDCDEVLGSFVEKNIALVQHKVDSRMVADAVKKLVCDLARGPNGNAGPK